MKLSEAIRLGAMLSPQTYGPFSDCHGTCAMGGALEAVGKLAKRTRTNFTRVRQIWAWLKWDFKLSHCPHCGRVERFRNVYNLIAHLNDDDHLTREQIAELVLRIEGRAAQQIDMLVPSYRKLRLGELEANLGKKRKKKNPTEPAVEVLQGK